MKRADFALKSGLVSGGKPSSQGRIEHMPLPVPDEQRALAQLKDATTRFTDLLRTADPGKNAIGHWSTGEVGVHVGHIFSMYVDFARGGVSPVEDHRNISPTWDRMVGEDTERDPEKLVARIENDHSALVEALGDIGWTDPVNWHGGLRVPAYALAGILVNETEIHGRDIALAESVEWHIPDPNAALAIESLYTVMPDYLKPEAAQKPDTTWQIKLRGASTTYFELSGATMNITTEEPDRVDCRLSVKPASYLLVGYGRIGRWLPLLKGEVVAYGRKPWLSLTFAKLFQSV